jgi:hypothetical protein
MIKSLDISNIHNDLIYKMIDCYLNEIAKQNSYNKIKSINKLVDTIMSFYVSAKKNGVIDIDNSRKILMTKLNQQQIPVSVPEIDDILDSHSSFLEKIHTNIDISKIDDLFSFNSFEDSKVSSLLESELRADFDIIKIKQESQDEYSQSIFAENDELINSDDNIIKNEELDESDLKNEVNQSSDHPIAPITNIIFTIILFNTFSFFYNLF